LLKRDKSRHRVVREGHLLAGSHPIPARARHLDSAPKELGRGGDAFKNMKSWHGKLSPKKRLPRHQFPLAKIRRKM
ncbi:MAG: hypothetical protein MUF04_13630, partial [Akkermansiaceae bacterium]|nr:hypothetical protein [Akkermansiaceae bacterium]